MMKYIVLSTLAEARKLQKFILWLMDLPKKGVHVGGGRHVTIQDTPPSLSLRKVPGWTTRYVDFVKHPSSGQLAVRVTPELKAAYQVKKDQLTAAQRQWLQDRIASEQDLADEWKKTDEDGNKFVPESEEVEPE